MIRQRNIWKMLAKGCLVIGLFIALFNPIICNEKAIAIKQNGTWAFPAMREIGIDLGLLTSKKEIIQYSDTGESFTLYPPIRYSYDYIPRGETALQPPLTQGKRGTHFLGSDRLGRDVLAGIMRGFYISFKIAFLSILFGGLIGVFIGICMGYYGDQSILWNIPQFILVGISSIIFLFYLIYPMPFRLQLGTFILQGLVSIVTFLLFDKLTAKRYGVPIDTFFIKIIEILKSIPTLIVLLAILPILSAKGTSAIVLLLAFLLWKNFARQSRGETFSIKKEDYIQTSMAQGQTDLFIMVKHIVPNLLPTILTLASFTFASVILLESYLSFLGIGLDVTEVSWGSLLAEGRINTSAWWLSVFPGLCIFIIILSINHLVDIKIDLDEKA